MRWTKYETLIIFERLHMYISSGLPVHESLRLIKKSAHTKLADSLEMIILNIESGNQLSQSLAIYANISIFTKNLLEHGEMSGLLSESIKFAHDVIEKEAELMKKCMSALTYPIIIGLFAGLLTIGMVKGIMPQIIPMLKNMGVELPLITRILIYISDHILFIGIYGLLAITAIAVSSMLLYCRSACTKMLVHMCICKIPLIGNIIYAYFLAMFLRSLGSLVSSGIPLYKAYINTVSIVSLLPLHEILKPGSDMLSLGQNLSTIFTHKNIPVYIPSLISAGEYSGSLGNSLLRTAEIVEKDIDNTLRKITTFIEPVMMIGMGGVVGSIALSIMMPIYGMTRVLQNIH